MNTASHSLDPKGPAFSEIQPYFKESLWRGKIFDGDWIESSGGQAQSDEEAVALASDSEYGLSLSIISSSLDRGLALSKRIPAGLVHINDQTIGDDPFAPFGGVGASGNGARHGGPANWEEFTQWQWVTLQARPPHYQF